MAQSFSHVAALLQALDSESDEDVEDSQVASWCRLAHPGG
jgi:hypothetical protein